uniref:Uncharacterized protein n=1 Tax=Knipowitschia caucasica TaxID=637954 RepID=A0AAV2JXS7_KNICA
MESMESDDVLSQFQDLDQNEQRQAITAPSLKKDGPSNKGFCRFELDCPKQFAEAVVVLEQMSSDHSLEIPDGATAFWTIWF